MSPSIQLRRAVVFVVSEMTAAQVQERKMKPFGDVREAFEEDPTALSDDSRVAGRSPIARFIDIMDKVSFALSGGR